MGLSDPTYAEKCRRRQAAGKVATGGGVWCGDETTVHEVPPLRATWVRRAEQAVVVMNGRSSRRVLLGTRKVTTGEFVTLVRERRCQDNRGHS
ncbi:MAG TPA: hypothetical protein VGF38_16975 [Ktedonobacterales bacterium]